jgi:signal transduction histidine kinase
LSRVLHDAEAFVLPMAREKGVELTFRITAAVDDRSLTTCGDEEKLRQVGINLVSNALKFTAPHGTVTVTCELDASERIAVRVSDTGIGIAASDLERIFEPFVQVGRTLSASAGTGLGLPISRELARAMGGDVTVTSRVGGGSTFALSLPRVDDRTPRAA